jgi:hypothetical protein
MGDMFRPIAVLVALTLFELSGAYAVSAPSQLRGKSITVSWTESRVQRNVGEANFRSVTASHRFNIYISSTGRMFSRLTNTTRRGTGSKDEVGGASEAKRTPVFSGQSLTVFIPSKGTGVRRVAVDFDKDFGSCTASVLRARPEGATIMTGNSIITGKSLEIQSVNVGAASCTIQSGNIFGTE